jgi:hypothetical protein
MEDLPQIAAVDRPTKFFNVVYEENETSRKKKVLANLNQIGFINYNSNKQCLNGHATSLKKVNKTDGWYWRCSTKGCQKTVSIRAGTFFFESKILIWEILLLITLLNIIYNHVLPGTTIHSDCWAAYNHIQNLDRQYHHRTVNHSLTFVAPDGTHTNSIESTWNGAKRQFKDRNIEYIGFY